MNTKKYFGICCIACVLLLTACKNSETTESTIKNIETTTASEYTMKEGDTQISGQVTAIVGNEVTLELASPDADAPQPSANGEMPDFANGEKPDFANGEMPDFANGEMPDFANGEMPSFGNGEMSNFANGEMPSGQGRRNPITLTGKTEVYLLPAGMSISGMSGRTSDFTAVTVGMNLRLTLNSDGDVVAAEVI